jgi:hypothetical protein
MLKFSVTAIALLAAMASMTAYGAGSGLVEVANLIYSGTKSSVCFSEVFLTEVSHETTIRTSRKFKAVKLGDAEIYDFPFAVMTGEGAFTLTAAERANLKQYLAGGGFLLASAGCSNADWDESFRKEMDHIFPNRKLSPIALTHPVFSTVFQIRALETKKEDAHLEGLSLGGKLVVIYTPDGLNDTTSMHGCCCCGGNEILNSRKINVNIITYALLQ